MTRKRASTALPDMDKIEFVSRPYREGERESGIQIKINGRDLVDLVRAVESPFASREGARAIAGAYAGLPPDENTCPPSRHFFGQPLAELYRYGPKTQVLGCECGEVGCWPLLCLIEVSQSRVTWSQFEQPHRRNAGKQSAWSYEKLGPFEFDRDEYEQALEALRAG
jgi:hypothetical protein